MKFDRGDAPASLTLKGFDIKGMCVESHLFVISSSLSFYLQDGCKSQSESSRPPTHLPRPTKLTSPVPPVPPSSYFPKPSPISISSP